MFCTIPSAIGKKDGLRALSTAQAEVIFMDSRSRAFADGHPQMPTRYQAGKNQFKTFFRELSRELSRLLIRQQATHLPEEEVRGKSCG